MATIKQKKALANLVENGGNVAKAMRDAGYDKDTTRDPSKLTKSKGFKELVASMDDYAIEKYGLGATEKAGRAYIDALEANKIHGTNDNFIEIPDHKVRIEAAKGVLEVHDVIKDKDNDFSQELIWRKK